MNRRDLLLPLSFLSLVSLITLAALPTLAADSDYQLGPDSMKKPGVPEGKVTEHQWLESAAYPGTKRRYFLYVPAQYDPAKPAALMVFQDGHAYVNPTGEFRVPVVFDNLIAEGAMPVTIGLFVDPGHRKDALPPAPGWNPAPENRAVEYDTPSPAYADFLLTELIPEIRKTWNITDNPDLRAIGGISSGGICAFTVAWEKPDRFRKVLSHVGSFVDIRGGYIYPGRIRKTEKKPLRVYLQDGENDLDNRFGNWPLANQQMAASLKYANYDYRFDYGTGQHSGKHGGAVLPDSLRWLWRDWQSQTP